MRDPVEPEHGLISGRIGNVDAEAMRAGWARWNRTRPRMTDAERAKRTIEIARATYRRMRSRVGYYAMAYGEQFGSMMFRLSCRLDPAELAAVERWCQRLGTSRQYFIRRALRWAIEPQSIETPWRTGTQARAVRGRAFVVVLMVNPELCQWVDEQAHGRDPCDLSRCHHRGSVIRSAVRKFIHHLDNGATP